MIIFNTTVLDKDYSLLETPIKRLIPIGAYGFPDEFYGGRVNYIAELKDSPLKLLVDTLTDGLTVVAVGANDMNDVSLAGLKQFAKDNKISVEKTITRDELVERIKPLLLIA